MTKHGHRLSNRSRSSTYLTWAGMKQRCLNPKHKQYQDYGGRGIKICKRWMKFEQFLKDMGVRPDGLTLDRINVDGSYCKRNCRWADKITQANNKRKHFNNDDDIEFDPAMF